MSEPGHILLIVRTDVVPEMEEEFNRFYDEEHVPRLLRVPGVLSAKRAKSMGAGPKYIAVYEHESAQVQETALYKEAVDTEWARRVKPHLRNFQREIYRLLPPKGASRE
jgi:hypothetical protein